MSVHSGRVVLRGMLFGVSYQLVIKPWNGKMAFCHSSSGSVPAYGVLNTGDSISLFPSNDPSKPQVKVTDFNHVVVPDRLDKYVVRKLVNCGLGIVVKSR